MYELLEITYKSKRKEKLIFYHAVRIKVRDFAEAHVLPYFDYIEEPIGLKENKVPHLLLKNKQWRILKDLK
jgi:hypothetical protein